MQGVHIIGTGSYVPKRVLTNFDLEQMVDTSDEWILSRTGIQERRLADKDEAASDMAYQASLMALDDAKVPPGEVDLLVVATVTPDTPFPSTACHLQRHLGASRAAAFDIGAACTGFVYGLSVAEQYLRTGRYRTILVVGVEVLSRIVDWTDRNTCVLFGDGAGAAVLQASEDASRGLLATLLHADGSLADHLIMYGGGSRHPISEEVLHRRLHFLRMRGNETFKIAVRTMIKASLEALDQHGYRVEDVDLFIPHQANGRIVEAVSRRLGIPDEKVFVNIERYGNTSAASIPMALDEALRSGRVKDGDLVLLVGVGAGLTWGSALFRW
ncbi:MAG: beta-ketoacyl-ACP synthase III [bacterium]|nr:beta-ketoacyl-ACP synthase III [bacterium]